MWQGLLCLLCACGVPGSWDLSMEVPCFLDGWGGGESALGIVVCQYCCDPW